MDTAQHATTYNTEPTASLHSNNVSSPPKPPPEDDYSDKRKKMMDFAKQLDKKSSTITINIPDNFKKQQYIVNGEAPFRINLKDHSTKTSTPLGPWEPEDLFNFIHHHRRSLSDSTIQPDTTT